jgi:hypothetical protein
MGAENILYIISIETFITTIVQGHAEKLDAFQQFTAGLREYYTELQWKNKS